MKKVILFAAVLAMSASAAMAQVSFGPKAGLNLANISNFDGDMKPGFYAGAFAEYQISDFFGVAGELLYSGQGSKDSYTDESGKYDVKQNLDYLNVPVLAKLYIAEGLSLDLGPQFGFLLSAKLKGEEDGVDVSVDNKDAYNGFDLSAGMGLTYNIGQFMIQGRYNLGLTDVMKNNEGDDKYKNNVIQFGVGYRF